MSLLASLVFALAAVVAISALHVTIAQYRDVAMANIKALRTVDSTRAFRVQTASVVTRPAVSVEIRRSAARNSATRRIRSLAGLRAAA